MRKVVTVSLFLLTFYLGGFAQNLPSFPVGQSFRFPDARSLGLGGAGTVSLSTPAAMMENPAALSLQKSRLAAQFSLGARKLQEDRSYRLYDRFDSVVDWAQYAINNNWYLQPEGAAAVRLPVDMLPDLTLALGSFVQLDQDYLYQEEVRENVFGDELMAYNRLELDGTLRAYAGAAAFSLPPLPHLSLGLRVAILKGNLDYLKQVNFLDPAETGFRFSARRTLQNTPAVVSFGALYRFSERLTVGVDVHLPYTFEYDARDLEGNLLEESIGYPLRLNAGFEYRLRQELQARLNVDAGYEFWSSVKYSGAYSKTAVNSVADNFGVQVPYTLELSDVFLFRAGVEHIFFNRIPFRVGLNYRNFYQRRGDVFTLLTAGTGFSADRWKVDVAAGVGNYTYSTADLFDDALFGGNRSNDPVDQVDENYFISRVTFSYFLNF